MLLNGDLPSLDKSFFMKEDYLDDLGINLFLGTRVINIFSQEKKVITAHMRYQKTLDYDYLILATGSRQADYLTAELNHTNILSTKDYVSSSYARKVLEDAQHIAIIGGGQIAAETTDALVNINKQVTIIEQKDRLLNNYFDIDFVQSIQSVIEFTGAEVVLNEAAVKVETNPLKIVTEQQEIYPDAIILATHLIPNSELVKDLVELNENGTIKVNDYLQTTDPNIFAVGDLIETPFSESNEDTFIALINNAIRSGQIAALNLTENRVKQSHSVRVMGTKIFNHYISSVGYTFEQASHLFNPAEITVQVPYTLDDDTPVFLKLVVEKESGKLLGAQFRSRANILSFTNLIALAIQDGLTDVELAFRDRLYYPSDITLNTMIYEAALACYQKRTFPHLAKNKINPNEELLVETMHSAFESKSHYSNSPVQMISTVSPFKLPKRPQKD